MEFQHTTIKCNDDLISSIQHKVFLLVCYRPSILFQDFTLYDVILTNGEKLRNLKL